MPWEEKVLRLETAADLPTAHTYPQHRAMHCKHRLVVPVLRPFQHLCFAYCLFHATQGHTIPSRYCLRCSSTSNAVCCTKTCRNEGLSGNTQGCFLFKVCPSLLCPEDKPTHGCCHCFLQLLPLALCRDLFLCVHYGKLIM